MKEFTENIKKLLRDNGADLVGIGDLSEISQSIRNYMPYGICVAVAIQPEIIKGIEKSPTHDYYKAYNTLNEKLDTLVTLGGQYIKNLGYEAYPQTRLEVAKNESDYSTMLPHKTIATRAGIGWIGKSALLVTKKYGSAVRISTILTNAPLDADLPMNEAKCGGCMVCTESCPAQAVKGTNWVVTMSREEIFDPVKCRRMARMISKEVLDKEITLCGKCIYVCPYTQSYINKV